MSRVTQYGTYRTVISLSSSIIAIGGFALSWVPLWTVYRGLPPDLQDPEANGRMLILALVGSGVSVVMGFFLYQAAILAADVADDIRMLREHFISDDDH